MRSGLWRICVSGRAVAAIVLTATLVLQSRATVCGRAKQLMKVGQYGQAQALLESSSDTSWCRDLLPEIRKQRVSMLLDSARAYLASKPGVAREFAVVALSVSPENDAAIRLRALA